MAALTPLAGKPSALAAFAATLEGRPRPLATPLGSPGSSLAPIRPKGESALEAFATRAAAVGEKEVSLEVKKTQLPLEMADASLKADSKVEISAKCCGDEEKGGQDKQHEEEKESLTPGDADMSLCKRSDDESDDCDSMAAFAFMDSDEEEEDKGKQPDIDDVYIHRDGFGENNDCSRLLERIFVPQSSKEELLDAILSKNVSLISHLLSTLTPTEALSIRDTELRTMYHYAALSNMPEVQAIIFNFIECYYSQDYQYEAAKVHNTQTRVYQWMKATPLPPPAGEEWSAPRVEELKRDKDKESAAAYISAIEAYDRSGRSFLHYCAVNRADSVHCMGSTLEAVLKCNPRLFFHKDAFDRDALTYAATSGNVSLIYHWFNHLDLGMSLKRGHIQDLPLHQISLATQKFLYNLLERIDAERIQTKQNSNADNSGLSIRFMSIQQASGIGLSIQQRTKGFHMRTTIHKAAIYGDEEGTRFFLDQGVDVNEPDSSGWTPLHHCVERGTKEHVAIAKLLLCNGAKVNARSLLGRTPLHILANWTCVSHMPPTADQCIEEASSIITLLCANGAKLEIYDDEHFTPFLAAVKSDNLQVVQILLEYGCDRFAVDKQGGCALHIAVMHGLERMAQFLSRWDADAPLWGDWKDRRGRTPRALAQNDSMRSALDNLWVAVHSRNIDRVSHHLQIYRSCHKRTKRYGYIGVDDKTPTTHRTALHLAVESLTSRLKTHFQDSKDSFHTMNTVISAILSGGAKVAERDKWGITPLMLSATLDSSTVIETLLKFATPEDLAQTDSNGNTALHYSYAFFRAKISSVIEGFTTEGQEARNGQGKLPLETTGSRERIFPSGYRDFLTHHNKGLLSVTTSRK